MSHPQILPLGRASSTAGVSIGEYLIRRLAGFRHSRRVRHSGRLRAGFYSMLEHSPINLVGCCREDNAGFAADAYARVNGMGAVCVTYCVGGLSVCKPHRRGLRREIAGGA